VNKSNRVQGSWIVMGRSITLRATGSTEPCTCDNDGDDDDDDRE
jgi:hypothetical protein